MAGPFDRSDFDTIVPADKKLDPAWVRSLFERGEPAVWTGKDLGFIGMPIGGICAGQVYLGGDGALWHWDIFNQNLITSGGSGNYPTGIRPDHPMAQGFTLRVTTPGQGGSQDRSLDQKGFPEVTFRGEYPIGLVTYRDDACPVEVSLEAFSPFIPLNADDSGLPVTILRYTVKNTSSAPVEATLAGWLQNAVLHVNALSLIGTRWNRVIRDDRMTFLECSYLPDKIDASDRPDIVFEDWSKEAYAGWTVEGTAFGSGPVVRSEMVKARIMEDIGGDTDRVVSSWATAPDPKQRNAGTGKLTSQPFAIERSFVHLWAGGGDLAGKTCVNLLIDGKPVWSVTGRRDNHLRRELFDARPFQGKQGVLEIVDAFNGEWGWIGVGKITFSDQPPVSAEEAARLFDMGTMGLALLGAPPELAIASCGTGGLDGDASDQASTKGMEPLLGSIGRKLTLAPGQSSPVDFLVTWHFPNLSFKGSLGTTGRYYATHFDSAHAVAKKVSSEFDTLTSHTRLWRDTWYDSTLPYWFLDRTFGTAVTLAATGCHRLADGRFYAWEGVGCCEGTCTHVWHYAQLVGRIFPELERDTRERVDLNIALNPTTGVIGFRGEYNRGLAVDGQAGTLLRFYREHQMSVDDTFLRSNWEKIKFAYTPLLALDAGAIGVMAGPQANTLDATWFGEISWLSSLYIAALRAGEAMGTEMGDVDFSSQCSLRAKRGTDKLTADLFNGEYYMNLVDPSRPETINSGTGCEIDQVFGQSWAFQVGLPRVLPAKETKTALQSLWKYNFTPDAGAYLTTAQFGRRYAIAGEAGLLLCSFPRSDWDFTHARGKGGGVAGYFNEVWTGTEYQAAGHMLWEGLVMEGMAVTKAVDDRYHPSKRNPYNEIECGDHYSRAMASYGVYIAACGFEYHGPKGHIGFAPRIKPEDFRAAFTAAEGWGSYAQKLDNAKLTAQIVIKRGRLSLQTVALAKENATSVQAVLDGKPVAATLAIEGDRAVVLFAQPLVVDEGRSLVLEIA